MAQLGLILGEGGLVETPAYIVKKVTDQTYLLIPTFFDGVEFAASRGQKVDADATLAEKLGGLLYAVIRGLVHDEDGGLA